MGYLNTYRKFGYWIFKPERPVRMTAKEEGRIYVCRPERHHRYYLRFPVMFHFDGPYPTWFSLEHKLPRKTLKALWKSSNGKPLLRKTEAPAHRVLLHNGRKA